MCLSFCKVTKYMVLFFSCLSLSVCLTCISLFSLSLLSFASLLSPEEEDRDLSCVVSSLVQLMLDPHFRSLTGFQSLVQKEWVMAGHRFLDRCNHLKKNDKEEVGLVYLHT